MIRNFFGTVALLLFGVSKQNIKNYFYSKRWYRDWYPEFYFQKINDNWNKLDEVARLNQKFKPGEELQEVYGSDWHFWLYCKNQPKCKNVINFAGEFLGETEIQKHPVWSYKCSCCGTVQHYVLFGPIAVECDKHGFVLDKNGE